MVGVGIVVTSAVLLTVAVLAWYGFAGVLSRDMATYAERLSVSGGVGIADLHDARRFEGA